MKKTKIVKFIINGNEVETIDGDEVTIDEVEKLKSALAAKHGIDYSTIEVNVEDGEVPELSDMFVRYDNSLMWQPKHRTYPVFVTGVRPAMDIHHEELFLEFLDLIAKKEFDKALIFS